MENIKTLYYERFIQHVVEAYSQKLKSAKPGHCMKITGLAMKELRVLLPLLRPLNSGMEVYILSETEKGDEYIHATKLIELRNNPDKSVLILVPSNSRTSAEDSYGDATFQNLSVAELQDSFVYKLISELPEEKEYLWTQMTDLFKEIKPARTTVINYLLYLETKQYADEAWGNGLYLFGMLPDKDLIKNEGAIRRRFMINLEKVSSVMADFSLTAADRIVSLPLVRNTVQKDLMVFFTSTDNIEDAVSLFENIHDNHPEFNYAVLPWIDKDNESKPVKVMVDIASGKDPKKELVRDADTGALLLAIPQDKKGKVSFTITTDPSPKDNPDIFSFEIALVNIDDFTEVGVVKKAKVGTNKRASRKLSLNIASGMFEDGEYMLRVCALDENGIVLDTLKVFKEERVQAAWLDAKEKNPNLQMEQYRLEQHVAYCNESESFTITTDEYTGEGEVDKRGKVNSYTQAIIHYRSTHLSKEEDLELPEGGADRSLWIEGTLNNTYQFDFGAAYAYQIQLPKKLIQLETTFLSNDDEFGHVEALLSGNPTDTKLLDPTDTAKQYPLFVAAKNLNIPDELTALRQELFSVIRESADNETGLTCTTDFTAIIGLVKGYLAEYDSWLRNIQETVIGLDLNECNTISLFGVQGAGKSYTIGSITEMVLRQFSKVNLLPAPMASVIFHYSDSMDYAPEFTSMVYPNDEAGQLAKLKAEYGAEPGSIKDVILLAPKSQVETRKAEYPDIDVHPIGFDSSELAVRDWMFLLGAMGNDSTYIKELKQIMKACRSDMSLVNIRNGVANSNHMSTSQRSLAEQKLDFAEEYITDGNKLQQYLKPGRLIIVDLRDEFIEKDEALGLFVVMLNIFSSVMKVDGRAFNKFIVFDEAHKYMNNKELVGSITTAIREMRHKGVSIMIASQDPMSLPTEIIELSSIVVMHRFSSPAWVKHVQKAITPLQTLTATEMAALGSGEAYLWANKASDKAITQRPIKISIRPRVTKHGGDTIQAVK